MFFRRFRARRQAEQVARTRATIGRIQRTITIAAIVRPRGER